MSGRGGKTLSAEDRILWARITRTAVPLKRSGRASLAETEEDQETAEPLPAERAPAPALAPRQTAPAQAAHPSPRSLDLPTRKKLAKGRLPIEGTVDLHGLTQNEAHALLLSFLHRAYADGRRYVLVITGKGESLRSDGILRRAVPAWFATPPFRALVSGQEAAGRRHGGAGAIYVRLRRQEKGGAR
jgi:DNA-nicking Smr family endonuclease